MLKWWKSSLTVCIVLAAVLSGSLVNAAAVLTVDDNCDNFENAAIVNATGETGARTVANLKTANSNMNFNKFADGTYAALENEGRMIKVEDKNTAESDQTTYIVYHTEDSMADFHIETFYCKKSDMFAKDMNFSFSSDGTNYSPLANTDITRTVVETEINGEVYNETNWENYFWRQVNFDTEFLPANTHYLKITFGAKSSKGAHYDLALSKVQISTVSGVDKRYLKAAMDQAKTLLDDNKENCGDGNLEYPQAVYDALSASWTVADLVYQNEAATSAEVDSAEAELQQKITDFYKSRVYLLPFIDECETFDRMQSYTLDNLSFSTGEAGLGDVTRITRKTDDDAASVVYRVNEDVKFIEVEGAFTKTAAEVETGLMAGDMTLLVSTDGQTFTPLNDVVVRTVDGGEENWGATQWRRIRYTAFHVPEQTRWLKIEFGKMAEGGKVWENQLMKVTMEKEVKHAILRDLKLKNNEDQEVTDSAGLIAGGAVTLTGNLTLKQQASQGTVIAALFDGDQLCGVSVNPVTQNGLFTCNELVIPESLDAPNVKVFLWNDMTELIPLVPEQLMLKQ